MKKLAYTLFLIAVVVLAIGGIYNVFKALLYEQELPLFVRLGLAGIIIAVIILFFYILFDRIQDYRQGK